LSRDTLQDAEKFASCNSALNEAKDLEKEIAMPDRIQSLQVYQWCLSECLVLLYVAINLDKLILINLC